MTSQTHCLLINSVHVCLFLVTIILILIKQDNHTLALDPVYKISSFLGAGSPSKIAIPHPYGIFVSPKDELYIGNSNKVSKVNLLATTLNLTTIAGTSASNSGNTGGSGGLATETVIGRPFDLAVNDKDEVFIVETLYSGVIRKVNTSGFIKPFAGVVDPSGQYNSLPFNGDGGLAVDVKNLSPMGIALNPLSGDVYVSDNYHYRIRVIYTNGTISTIAGNGDSSYGGDGSIATQSGIGRPDGLAFNSKNGMLYFTAESRVIQLNVTSGIMSTLAGTGVSGMGGDGLAVNTQIGYSFGVCVGLNGEVFIADNEYYVIRKVSPNGLMTTIAGKAGYQGEAGEGDGGLASNALLGSPTHLTIDSKGFLYIVDEDYSRVRRLEPICLEGVLVNNTCDLSITCYGKLYNDSNVCNGNGKCAGIDNCICNDGWKGNSQCSQFTCELLNNCYGNGQCISNNTCFCQSGWKGFVNCSGVSCDGVNECSGHGQCVSNNTCLCENGWKRHLNCSATSCELLNECNSHGICVSNNTCLCESGWDVNNQCSQFTCRLLNNCSGNGECIGANKCQCESGWKGNEKCSQFSCDSSNSCSNHGQCISNNTCQCEIGWKGDEKCSQFSCELMNHCNGHGKCVSNNTCQCESGWRENNQCSSMSCDGVNECSGHGSCISNNTCKCYSNWIHSDCSIKECFVIMDENSQLLCANLNSLAVRELYSKSFNNLWIEFNEANYQIYSPVETVSNLDFSVRYFMSSSIIPSHGLFYSSIINVIIQDSNSTLVPNVKVSNNLKFFFNNLQIDQQLFNYTCLRFDSTLGRWTNDSISTLVSQSSKQITCSTNYLNSVTIQRSLLIISNITPKESNQIVARTSNSIIGMKSVLVKDSVGRIVNFGNQSQLSMLLILLIGLLWIM